MTHDEAITGKSEFYPGVFPRQGLESADLTWMDSDFSQLIIVSAGQTGSWLDSYEKDSTGLWSFAAEIGRIICFIGKNGLSSKKQESDGCTPAGLFKLGYAFGNSNKPETTMHYRAVTEVSYWVDDPDSSYYNQWVEANPENIDWKSAEHLALYKDSYAYAVVIEYNTAPNTIAGAGSAIFLHCGVKPTSGCIAVSEHSLLKLLKWLKPEKEPHILIAGELKA